MFYANVFLAKKSALTRVWLAAHWDKKLTKAHVFETNIAESIGEIISPKQKLALRTTGHLLLGVVRIYSRKAKYLLTDCSEAFVKIKMAFRPGVVDMPEETREAPMHAVTLPEVFHDFDSTMMDFGGLDMPAQFGLNQGRAEEITMREDISQNKVFSLGDFEEGGLGGMSSMGEFGMTLEEPEVARKEAELDHTLPTIAQDLSSKDEPIQQSTIEDSSTLQEPPAISNMLNMSEMNDLGGEFLEGTLNLGDYSTLDPLNQTPVNITQPQEDGRFSSGMTPQHTGLTPHRSGMTPRHDPRYTPQQQQDPRYTPQHQSDPRYTPQGQQTPKADPSGHYVTRHLGNKEVHEPMLVQEDEFLLEPMVETGDYNRTRKKRKLVIDTEKQLSSDFIRRELDSTQDIVQAPSFAPPTRKSMHWKATAGVDKLFSTPGRPGLGVQLNKLLTHNLTLNFPNEQDEEEEESGSDAEVVLVKEQPEASPVKKIQNVVSERAQSPVSSDDDAGAGDDFFEFNFGGDESSSDDEQRSSVPQKPTADPQSEDEEQEGETFEDFDNRRWNKRTEAVLLNLRRDLDTKGQVNFFAFSEHSQQKQAASKFYSVLLLKKAETINVSQSEPFSDIIISAGPKYHEV